MTRKEQLIIDIQNLLNAYDNVKSTSINPALLAFMDENTLVNIIDSLLTQKEESHQSNVEWLSKFKSHE